MQTSLNPYRNRITCGDAQEVLRGFPSECIDSVVTSPPYYRLRDYGVIGQIGLEASFDAYVERLCDLFDEIKRVLKPEGTCWVNLGDTFGGSGTLIKANRAINENKGNKRWFAPSLIHRKNRYDKCLLQIPSRFSIEMINRGWTLRNEIIWHKPNCLPSSARDRFTVDFEKLFFFVKSKNYYFRQQYEPLADPQRLTRRMFNPENIRKRKYGDPLIAAFNPKTSEASRQRILKNGRFKRAVWKIGTVSYRGEHFAVYPPKLIETPILAGCPAGGIVLDPFVGSGTTALVAKNLNRQFIGIDLNPNYVELAKQRLKAKDNSFETNNRNK